MGLITIYLNIGNVHPLSIIFNPPPRLTENRETRNCIFFVEGSQAAVSKIRRFLKDILSLNGKTVPFGLVWCYLPCEYFFYFCNE